MADHSHSMRGSLIKGGRMIGEGTKRVGGGFSASVPPSFSISNTFHSQPLPKSGVPEERKDEDLIIVELYSAKNVLPMDKNERSDPLVITKLASPLTVEKEEKCNMKVLHGNQVGFIQKNFYRSSICYRTLNPVWDESYIFWVDPKAKPKSLVLKFELFDWDRVGADHLGNCSLSLAEVKQYTSLTTLELPISIDGIKQKQKDKRDEGGTLSLGVVYVKKNDLETHHLVAEAHMESLFDLFFERPSSIPVTAAIAYSETTEEMSQSICELSLEADKARELCKELVRINVALTNQESTLFRTNSTATKMVRTLFTQNGQSYIKSAIGGIIAGVLENPNGYEINKSKIPDRDKDEERALHPDAPEEEIIPKVLEKNKQKLHGTCVELVEAVIKSLNNCPDLLCQILSDTRAIVEKSYPDSSMLAVGGFYFLRFVVPCVATPEHYGMTDLTTISQVQRRALTVISKVIQNMANAKSFDHKEGFMTMMNSTIDELTPSVQKFLDDISKREPPLEDTEIAEPVSKPSVKKENTFLRGSTCGQTMAPQTYSDVTIESMAYFIARLSNSFESIHQKMVVAEQTKHAEFLTLIYERLAVACEVTEEGTNSLLRSLEGGTEKQLAPSKSETARNRLASTPSSAHFSKELVPPALAQTNSKKKVLWKTGGELGSDTIDLAASKTFTYTKDDLPAGPYVLKFGVLPVVATVMTVSFNITFISAQRKEIIKITQKLCHTDDEETRTVNVGMPDAPAKMIFSCTASMGLLTMKVRASLAQGEKKAFLGQGRRGSQPGNT